jgi:hypothetical protein
LNVGQITWLHWERPEFGVHCLYMPQDILCRVDNYGISITIFSLNSKLSQNKMLSRDELNRKWQNVHNEEFHDLYFRVETIFEND